MASSASFRKVWFWAHWIVGTTAGLVLAVIGATGAVLAFETQILNALNHDARTVPVGSMRLSPPELMQQIERHEQPGSVATFLYLPSDPNEAVRVHLSSPPTVRYIDPYTGAWQVQSGTRGEDFFTATRSLHRWLMMSDENREAGRHIVGVCTILLVGLALSGLYLRWPRRLSDWRAWMLVRFRLRGRGFLASLHAALGTYVLIPYLFLALTGLFWTYEWYRETLYRLAGVEKRAETTDPTPARPTHDVMARAWSGFLVASKPTGFDVVLISVPTTAGRPIQFRYLAPGAAHERAFDVLAFDAATGAVLHHEKYADRSVGGKLVSSIYALHTGAFFGAAGPVLLMLASSVMPVFAVTGWMMYVRRRR